MTDRLDLPLRYRRIVEALLREHVPEAEVWAYGSRVNGESHEGSDLDLVVRGPDLKRIPSGPLAGLIEALEDSNVPILVQTHDWARLPESFHQEIEQNYVVVREGVSAGSAGLSGEWGKVTLGDVCTKIGSGSTPRGGKEVYLEDGPFALIRSQNVYNDGFARDGLAFISDEYAEALHNVEVLPDDVLLNITGDSVARVCQVDTTVLPARVNQHVAIIRPDSDKLDAAYLRYYLAAPEVQEMLLSWAGSGATRNALTKQMIESFQVRAPTDLAEQRAIAHVLGSLDDRIELNRRMNETLEEMARALFKSWFVDFDPVRAKMEGCWRGDESLPGLPAEYYDLFPERLVPSELGKIPKGWEVKAIGDCFNVTMGQSPPGSTYNDYGKGLPFFQGNADFGFRYPEKRKYCTAPTRVARPDDTLVSVRAPVGAINVAWEQCCIGRGVATLQHSSGSTSFTYYSAWALQGEIQQYEHTGTVFGSITKSQLEALRMVEPPAELVDWYETQVQSMDKRIRSNVSDSRTLIYQRDALLPRLVSGAVRVTCSLGSRFSSMSTQVQ